MKRLISAVVCFAFICFLGSTLVGCSGDKKDKKVEPAKDAAPKDTPPKKD